MTYTRKVVRNAAIGVAIAETPDGLATIHHPGCAAAIWRREPLPRFQDWIDRVDPTRLPTTRMVIGVDAVREAVRLCCDAAKTPVSPELDMLVDDIAALAHCFAEIVETASVRLRLDVARAAPPETFHIDDGTSQLICTYRGPGTQYGISVDGAEPKRVFATPTGSPILLRGARWPEGPASGLLHRAPPISDTRQTRLRLVLEPVVLHPADQPVRATTRVVH